ncbi:hypothetical protein GCM10025788_17110 [Serinicoccus chungangensis]
MADSWEEAPAPTRRPDSSPPPDSEPPPAASPSELLSSPPQAASAKDAAMAMATVRVKRCCFTGNLSQRLSGIVAPGR